MTRLLFYLLLLVTLHPEISTAQQNTGIPENNRDEHLFRRNRFKPVRIRSIDRPVRLRVDQVGYFSANINIETVSLPFRSTWVFGDGNTVQGLTASHTYTTPGAYTVMFKAWNKQSADSLMMEVRVEDPESPARIISVGLKYSLIEGRHQVQFNPVVLGTDPIDFLWSFDNGSSSTGTNPIQVFEEMDVYTIELEVNNNYGQHICDFDIDIEDQAAGTAPSFVTCSNN